MTALRPFYPFLFTQKKFAKSSLHVQDECPANGGFLIGRKQAWRKTRAPLRP